MGEAGRKQYNRKSFLLRHPNCVYCGAPATTTDHCPPRSFFIGRHWPESYEFPACKACNEEVRLDEQALAVLVRIPDDEGEPSFNQDEWIKLVQGLINNQPLLYSEWSAVRGVEAKQFFRKNFGSRGDAMRYNGWGALSINGPLTKALIKRFMIKMTKAFYYRHNGKIFDGVAYVNHRNIIVEAKPDAVLTAVLHIAPELAVSQRNNQDLSEQFIYRFNYSPEVEAMYAVVRFSNQFIFSLTAVSFEMDDKLMAGFIKTGIDPDVIGRTVCALAPESRSGK